MTRMQWCTTDVGGILVVVVVRDVSSQAEVGDFQHEIVGNEDVPCGQVTMNALHKVVNRRTSYNFHDTHTAVVMSRARLPRFNC